MDARFLLQSARGIAFCLLLFAARHASAELTLLDKIAQASKTLDYQGTFIYSHETALEALRIVHAVRDGQERERLISLSGAEREVIRDGAHVACTLADDKAILVEQREAPQLFGLALTKSLDQAGQHYTIKPLGTERVAGRITDVMLIAPKTQDRYSYQLWIDQATYLPLRSMVLGAGNKVLEQMMFTMVEIGMPIPDSALANELTGAGYTQYTSHAVSAQGNADDIPPPSVGWVPSGFNLKDTHRQRSNANGVVVQHAVFTDGLAMVSVFVEKLSGGTPPLQGYSSMGAVNAFSRLDHEYQITVVGEIPQATVRKIAASVVVN